MEKGSLTGKVILVNDTDDPSLDPVDFSGVTVALYPLAILDTTIVRINNTFPDTGIQISQMTEFDHRLQNPMAITSTGADGKFLIKKIPVGAYNVVFLKEGWSIKYLFSVGIVQNDLVDVSENQIKPAVYFSGYVSESVTFKADKVYIVTGTTSFIAPVTIESGTQIYVSPDESIRFHENMQISGGTGANLYWKMGSAHNLYTNSATVIDSNLYFTALSMYAGNINLNHGLIRHVRDGVNFFSNGSSASMMDIKHFSSGFSFNNCGGSATRISARYGSLKAIQILSPTDSLTVSHSILYKTHDGISAYTAGRALITDNYFHINYNAIRAENNNGTISHNEFNLNQFDINLYSSSYTISNNNFYYTKDTTIAPRGFVLVSRNNFYRTGKYFVSIRKLGGTVFSWVYANVDAKYNYWAVADIDLYIYDALDNAQFPEYPCPFSVIYLPKLNTKNPFAGIRR
ncbi:MAG: right-handed parallel beta-helix repeat-containing protein [Candidatus Cloacimonadaceae bacterium]|nr:right-handed parallel beta-helix repeat-containing protein [Candidatus Cloacimonadaceae bacterium]